MTQDLEATKTKKKKSVEKKKPAPKKTHTVELFFDTTVEDHEGNIILLKKNIKHKVTKDQYKYLTEEAKTVRK